MLMAFEILHHTLTPSGHSSVEAFRLETTPKHGLCVQNFYPGAEEFVIAAALDNDQGAIYRVPGSERSHLTKLAIVRHCISTGAYLLHLLDPGDKFQTQY